MLPQGVTPAPGVTKDLEALFDGKTLDGWRIEGDVQWTVSDGAIQGGGEGSGVLVSQRAFADFELEADVKFNSGKLRALLSHRPGSEHISRKVGRDDYQVV